MATLDDIVKEVKIQFPEEIANLEENGSSKARLDTVTTGKLFDSIQVTPSVQSKSAKQSQLLRTEGNILFKKKKHELALRKYNDSILSAPFRSDCTDPPPSGPSALAWGFVSRSALLFQQEKYSECLADVDASLRHGCPSDQLYKVLDRAARSHQKISQWARAEDCYQQVSDALEESSLEESTRSQWKRRITQEIQLCRKHINKDESKAVVDQSGLSMIKGMNRDYPCAAEAVTVQTDPEAGRGAFTREPMSVGDLVLLERPFVSVLHPEYYSTHCYACLRPVEVAFPCRQCAAVRYCSVTCEQLSWEQYHKVECQHMAWLSEQYLCKLGHAALRVILKAGREIVDQGLLGTCMPESAADTEYQKFCTLVTHDGERDWESDLQLLTMTVHLAKVLRSTGYLDSLDMDVASGYRNTCAHLLRALQAVQCNGIAITEMVKPSDFTHCVPRDIGIGIYLTASLLNHSCDPSADLAFYGDRCFARCMCDLEAGEQITIDYGPVFHTISKSERRYHLKLNYFFSCSCRACTNDWPTFDGMNGTYPTFKCQRCQRPLPPDLKVKKCDNCSWRFAMSASLERLSDSHQRFAEAHELVLNDQLVEALPTLQEHLSLMQKLLCAPWKEYYSCQAIIAQTYRILATRGEGVALTVSQDN